MSRRSEGRSDWLGRFGKVPANAIEPCIRCSKPETDRAFVIDGHAAWTAAALIRYAGLPSAEATAIAKHGCEVRGITASQGVQSRVLLCRGCARKTGAPVYSVASLNTGREINVVTMPSGPLHDRVAATGLVLCPTVKDGEPAFYTTAVPELIAEDVLGWEGA